MKICDWELIVVNGRVEAQSISPGRYSDEIQLLRDPAHITNLLLFEIARQLQAPLEGISK